MGNNYGPRRVEIIQPFYFSKTRAPFIMRATFLITPTAYCWFKREASVAGVNVVSLMPIRRGCASVNRVNRVQGNQCARETRPVAERTHTHAAPAPFYLLSAALKLARAHPVHANTENWRNFQIDVAFPPPYFSSIRFPICMYVHEWKLERRDSLKIVASPGKKLSRIILRIAEKSDFCQFVQPRGPSV